MILYFESSEIHKTDRFFLDFTFTNIIPYGCESEDNTFGKLKSAVSFSWRDVKMSHNEHPQSGKGD